MMKNISKEMKKVAEDSVC